MMRLAVIGRGRWGSRIVATLETLEGVELLAESRDLEAILTSRPAGVFVATPSASHASVALPTLEAGIPTFIEKPFTTSVSDARRLRQAARRSGAGVFIGHVQLFNPAFQAVQAEVPRLGPLQQVVCQGMSSLARADSSVLWDWLPHFLAMARAIGLPAPRDVRTTVYSHDTHIQAADCRFTCDETELIVHTSSISPVKQMQMAIIGEQGALVFDDTGDEKAVLEQCGRRSVLEYSSDRPLTRELTAFLEMIRAGGRGEDRLDAEVELIQHIESAHESAQRGGTSVVMPVSG